MEFGLKALSQIFPLSFNEKGNNFDLISRSLSPSAGPSSCNINSVSPSVGPQGCLERYGMDHKCVDFSVFVRF